MFVTLQIDYVTNENQVTVRGSFPKKRRSLEEVAYDWWKQIKREMPFECQLVKVIAGNEDITEKVKELSVREK